MQKLDLHEMPHEDVEWAVIRFIEDNWDTDKIIEVVTGNSSAMRNIVKGVAEEYGLSYTVGEFNSPCYGVMRIQM